LSEVLRELREIDELIRRMEEEARAEAKRILKLAKENAEKERLAILRNAEEEARRVKERIIEEARRRAKSIMSDYLERAERLKEYVRKREPYLIKKVVMEILNIGDVDAETIVRRYFED